MRWDPRMVYAGTPLQLEPLDMEGTFDTINTAFWDQSHRQLSQLHTLL